VLLSAIHIYCPIHPILFFQSKEEGGPFGALKVAAVLAMSSATADFLRLHGRGFARQVSYPSAQLVALLRF
jgi:hypothetical protein